MATFLVKTEPGEYSYADLARDKRCTWEGVTNNAALLHLRSIRKGDEVLVYHTGNEKAVVGLARSVSDPYEDPSRPGTNAKGRPRFAVVDLVPVRAARTPATLEQIKADKHFAAFPLVTQGRLSVMAVPDNLSAVLRSMAGL